MISVACGYAHTLFLLKTGAVYACGNGMYGQLGLGSEVKKKVVPQIVPLPEKVIAIASKFFHSLSLSESGKLYTWGTNPMSLKFNNFLKRRTAQDQSSSNVATEFKRLERKANNDYLSIKEVKHEVIIT